MHACVYVGTHLPLRASPISAVTKRIVGIFDVMEERENCLVGSNCQKAEEDFSFFTSSPSLYPIFLFFFLSSSSYPPSPPPPHYPISSFCSPHRCVFLEASEPACLIEPCQVYGRGWGEATVNHFLLSAPWQSQWGWHAYSSKHIHTDTHANKCTCTHTPKQKSGFD